ncbi:MAG: aspartate-semialdehyde dehydrogenase, partial [Anaerolineae bacterium]
MMNKVAVGILGATGIVGQQYVQLLADHPLFEIAFLTASSRNSGKTYREAVAGRWRGLGPTPEKVFNLPVYGVDDIKRASSLCRFVFSALDTDTAKVYEQLYASKGLPVISNTSAHRLDPDVPLLIPEINPHHLAMIPLQKKRRGWENGFIVAKPNCSLQSYLMPLAPLHETFKIRKIIVTTMQSVSGGGYPGVASLDIHDNIIPYIPNEEEKSEKEVLKILGRVAEDRFAQEEDLIISAHCNRVPVLDGHLACVSVGFEKKPTLEQILSVWEEFRGLPQQ